MVVRLAAWIAFSTTVLLFPAHSAALKEDCSPRIDIVDGTYLPKSIEKVLGHRILVSNRRQCAIQCYRHSCDVAYYHRGKRMCQYSKNSTTMTSHELCADPKARLQSAGSGNVANYCVSCPRDSRNSGMPQATANTATKQGRIASRTAHVTTPNRRQGTDSLKVVKKTRKITKPKFLKTPTNARPRWVGSTTSQRLLNSGSAPVHLVYQTRGGVSRYRTSNVAGQKRKGARRFFHRSQSFVDGRGGRKNKGTGIA